MKNGKRKIFLFVLLLIVVSMSAQATTFGTTTFDYNVYNEKGESYRDPIITPPLQIGYDIKLEGSIPQYICGLETDKITPSVSDKECWINTLNYYDYEGEYDDDFVEPEIYTMRIGEEIKVGDYFYVTWLPSGTYREEWIETIETEDGSKEIKHTGFKPYQWRSTYKIELKGDYLQSSFDDKEKIIAINSYRKSNVKIINRLSNGLNGGIYLTSKTSLLYSEKIDFIDLVLNRDEQDYNFNLDTSTLGYDTLTIQPYIKFNVPRTGELIIYDDRKSEITYNVVPNIDITIDTSIKCLDGCPTGFHCEEVEHQGIEYSICLRDKTTPPTIYERAKIVNKGTNFLGIGIILFILLFIYLVRKI